MRNTPQLLSRLLLVPIALGLAACDNPVDHEDDHPEGLVVVNAQGEAVAQRTLDGGVTGEIAIGLDGTETFTVHALAEDGDRITIDGDELEVVIDTAPQGWTAEIQSENQLVLGADAAGVGTLELVLMHAGHAELSAVFPVVAQ